MKIIGINHDMFITSAALINDGKIISAIPEERISREKLAYIIDTTAAPVACIALISTWIGYEVGLINDAISCNFDLFSKKARLKIKDNYYMQKRKSSLIKELISK